MSVPTFEKLKMLTKFHEHRATSHLYTEGTSIRYPITFDTMLIPGGKMVCMEFTYIMEYKTSIIRGILILKHKEVNRKVTTLHQIHEASLAHINAQISLQ